MSLQTASHESCPRRDLFPIFCTPPQNIILGWKRSPIWQKHLLLLQCSRYEEQSLSSGRKSFIWAVLHRWQCLLYSLVPFSYVFEANRHVRISITHAWNISESTVLQWFQKLIILWQYRWKRSPLTEAPSPVAVQQVWRTISFCRQEKASSGLPCISESTSLLADTCSSVL